MKMRKSLGEKRKEISAAQIEEITRLYGDFAEGEKVKIFPNEAFGFLRITVERPLRLRWEVTDETIAAVGRGQGDPEAARRRAARRRASCWRRIEALSSRRERELVKTLGSAADRASGCAGPAQKAVWSALGRPRRGGSGHHRSQGQSRAGPRPARQRERSVARVPVSFVEDPTERLATLEYRTAVDDYMRDEVLPYVPDAWVDHAKTKIGYEIPLTRHFYKYVPPRPLEEIDAEIKALGGRDPAAAGRGDGCELCPSRSAPRECRARLVSER